MKGRNILPDLGLTGSRICSLSTHRGPVSLALLTLVFSIWIPFACQAPTPKSASNEASIFRTTPPSRLFFANIRSSSYYRERPAGTELDVYRFRRFSQTAQRPMLIPIIVEAYLKDEAYVFVRPNDFQGFHSPITLQVHNGTPDTLLRLDDQTRPGQLQFASLLYEHLMEGDTLQVLLRDSSWQQVYELRAERAAFFSVMQDYYRLTERL